MQLDEGQPERDFRRCPADAMRPISTMVLALVEVSTKALVERREASQKMASPY